MGSDPLGLPSLYSLKSSVPPNAPPAPGPSPDDVTPLAPDAHIHLIAACGTAMGSLAGLLKCRGYRVTGSDRNVYPPLSDFLRAEGIRLFEGFDPGNIDPAPDLVVVGNAVSRGNPELEAVLDAGLPYTSLPEILRDLFLAGSRPIVATGTHGKTTTTAMAAFLLRAGGLDPSWLVAGLPRDPDRPYHLGADPWFVIEGDEYDSAYFAKTAKFLYYRPHVLIINNIEFDHADIYRDLDEIRRAFRQVVNQVPRTGVVLANGDDSVVGESVAEAPAPVETFGLGPHNHWRACEVETTERGQSFDLVRDGQPCGRLRLSLGGEHNLRNALGSLAAAAFTGADLELCGAALSGFVGVSRRQEHLGTIGGVRLIDDFAHHPTAVAQTLAGVRRSFPGSRLWAVFEPASASNARSTFEALYVQAFSEADAVILGAVPRPERSGEEEPFSPDRLAGHLRSRGLEARHLPSPEAIAAHLADHAVRGDTVLFMSNAGFGGVQRLTAEALRRRS